MSADLLSLDACSLARAFRQAETTPLEYIQACLERIYQADARLGAFNSVIERKLLLTHAKDSEHRYRKGAPLSPLDGIPFAVKANIAIRMTPWHAGIAALSSRMAIADSAAVSTMRAAGMIPIGITNMHEAALGVTTDNWAFGRTLNPHDPRHIPGGSSGGSAAAGEIPVDGLIPLSPRLDHIGIHVRSMADIKATMRLFSRNVDDMATLPPFKYWRTGTGLELEPRILAAHNRLLDSLDCDEPIDWKWVDLSTLRRAGLLVCERDAEHTLEDALRDCRHGFSEEFRSLIDWAKKVPAHKDL